MNILDHERKLECAACSVCAVIGLFVGASFAAAIISIAYYVSL